MATMTSRERLLCAFRRGRPDRVPVGPQTFGRLAPESALAQELVRRTDITLYAGGAGDCFIGSAVPHEVIREGELTTTVYHTPRGAFRRVVRTTGYTSAQIVFPCRTAADVERVLAIPYAPPTAATLQQALDTFAQRRDWLGEEGLVLWGLPDAVCFPAQWLSPEDFCLLWADAPEVMAEMVRVGNARLLDYVARVCATGVDAFRIVGGEYVSVQLGPAAFDRLVRLPDAALVRLIHAHDGIAYYHNHGPIMRYLSMLADTGIDALDPLEAPPWGDCDIGAAKRLLAGRVCLVGNLDDMEILGKRPAGEVRQMGRRLLETAGPDGFYLSGTASGTYDEAAARRFLELAALSAELAGAAE
jgi:hypothetical protein